MSHLSCCRRLMPPVSFSFYAPFFCPRQHLSPKTEMWWVALVQRRVMELLQHSRCRVKAACHTRYFSPLLTDGRFAITCLCLHIWRRDGSCQAPWKRWQHAIVSPLICDMTRNQISRHNCNYLLQKYMHCRASRQSRVCHPSILSCIPHPMFFIKPHGWINAFHFHLG